MLTGSPSPRTGTQRFGSVPLRGLCLREQGHRDLVPCPSEDTDLSPTLPRSSTRASTLGPGPEPRWSPSVEFRPVEVKVDQMVPDPSYAEGGVVRTLVGPVGVLLTVLPGPFRSCVSPVGRLPPGPGGGRRHGGCVETRRLLLRVVPDASSVGSRRLGLWSFLFSRPGRREGHPTLRTGRVSSPTLRRRGHLDLEREPRGTRAGQDYGGPQLPDSLCRSGVDTESVPVCRICRLCLLLTESGWTC